MSREAVPPPLYASNQHLTMANFDELKIKGNEFFKQGQFELALEFYSKALEISPSNHIALSNRSLTFFKLER